MQIEVELFSILRRCLPPEIKRGRLAVPLPESATLRDLVSHLRLDTCLGTTANGFAAETAWQILVNGAFESNIARVLQDGDEIQIFPPMVGG